MKHVDLGAVVRYRGELVEVFAVGEGKQIHMRPINAEQCPVCNHDGRFDLLESSPLFQDGVEAVPTVEVP